MELNSSWLVVLKVPRKYLKTQQQCLTLILTQTQLLKITYRPCCQQFRVGTIFFLANYTRQLYHHTEGGVDIITDVRQLMDTESSPSTSELANVTGQLSRMVLMFTTCAV